MANHWRGATTSLLGKASFLPDMADKDIPNFYSEVADHASIQLLNQLLMLNASYPKDV
jgi:hypothetical protein